MKTITTYELLGMIKDGKAPKKIKYNDKIWNYKDGIMEYISEDTYFGLSNFEFDELNEKVEILEEEKKLPDKLEEIGKIDYDLGYIDYKNIEELKNWLNNDIQSILNELDLIVKNQNQLIDYLESKEKGE